jgi:signal transduction histidine kinase/CheY-like chemotaxis protein
MTDPAEAYPFPAFGVPVRLAIATVIILVVFLLDQYAGRPLDAGSHFLLMGIAVIIAAWFAGTGAALGAMVVAAALGAYRMATRDEAGFTQLALFIVHALLVTAVVAELRRARRQAEARAREAQVAREQGEMANRMKDEFLGTISHELRTPLNAVLGWVHLLRTGKLDAGTASRGLESIDRNVRLQAQLTSNLLDVSKALTGRLRVDSRPTALDDAVRQVVATSRLPADAKGVRIETSFADGTIVQGDPERLRQIAWQLLANAIKFSSRGGVVEVAVDVLGPEARLIVRDNGPGIDPKFLPRVFDRFTQADPSPTRKAGGLGVGLALVSELVELHGGEIEARNREDGAGSIFIVRFPLKSVEKARPSIDAVHAVEGNGNRPFLDGLRVLVLDQEPEGRDLLRTVLQHRGATVQTVSSVADALQHLETWRPDVLVSDSLSPEHDSYALVGKVHSLEADRGGRIPAVALTTAARTDERLRHMLADVQSDVPKPVEPAVLMAEIARLAGRERRRTKR